MNGHRHQSEQMSETVSRVEVSCGSRHERSGEGRHDDGGNKRRGHHASSCPHERERGRSQDNGEGHNDEADDGSCQANHKCRVRLTERNPAHLGVQLS